MQKGEGFMENKFGMLKSCVVHGATAAKNVCNSGSALYEFLVNLPSISLALCFCALTLTTQFALIHIY